MEMVFMKRNVMYFVSIGLLVGCLSTPLSAFAAQPPVRSDSQPPVRSESQPRSEQPPAQSETKPPARSETPPAQGESKTPAHSESQPRSESQPPAQGETKPPVRSDSQPPAQSETKPPVRSESQPPAQSETKPPARSESAQPSANTESQLPTSNETAPQSGNDSDIKTVTPAPPAPQQNKSECKKVQKINVDALVEAGIINKETGVKVKAYLKEYYKEKKAERAEVKKMKEEDRRAYYQNKYPYGEPDIWLDMAAAGILTLDEANAIKDALQEKVD